ncbi:uroporphyrinogen-III synthase [Ilumatobacter sp.]|uniref:uroporphyrinogen-III synthase n=1 Tax=Ilumatobacter sp. TaxID=1967498 RepID=UPI0037531E3B
MSSGADTLGPLAGRRVLITRARPGELGRLLGERGADVVHVPLIETTDPADGGVALAAALGNLSDHDWLIVTSAVGAERVGDAAKQHPGVALAAVGTTTARVLADLAGRPIDVVPDRQIAVELAAALNVRLRGEYVHILLAQADRAPDTLADLLRSAGHDVTVVTAYSTQLRVPDPSQLHDIDALVLASGSAATSWVAAFGTDAPPVVVAIGPTTAQVARELGLKVSAIAADYSLAGLVDAVERQFVPPE